MVILNEFQLALLQRVKNNHRIDIPIGDQEYIQHYFDTIDYLEKNGYIKINSRNNEFVTSEITNVGISALDNA